MKVAVYSHTLAPSGAELALSRTAPQLQAQGIDLTVIHGDDGPLRERLLADGITLRPATLPPSLLHARRNAGPGAIARLAVSYVRYVLRLSRTLRQERFDLVHANSLKSALLVSGAARLAGIPVVWHMRDRFTEDYLGGRAAVIRALCRWSSAGVVANSQSTLATLGRFDKPAGVAYSPLSEDVRFRERPRRPGPLRVAMIGRIAPWKGQLQVVRALAMVPGSWSTAVFAGGALFGEDEYADEVAAEIRGRGLQDRIVLAGHVDDPGRLLDEADVLVHASVIPEPLGQVVIEGVAAGLPVCASRAGGPAEILEDGVTGLLHEPGDVSGLARHIERLAEDVQLRAALVAGGRPLVACFSSRRSAQSIIAVWSEVRAGRRPRADVARRW